jgi:hypothetical protein
VSGLTKRYSIILTIMAVMAIISFAALHLSCHSGAYSLCLLTLCAFILTITGLIFLVGMDHLLVCILPNRGAFITLRLERPPRT